MMTIIMMKIIMVTKIMVTTKMMATNGISGNGGSNVKRRKKNKDETKRMRNTTLMRDNRNKGVEYMYSEGGLQEQTRIGRGREHIIWRRIHIIRISLTLALLLHAWMGDMRRK